MQNENSTKTIDLFYDLSTSTNNKKFQVLQHLPTVLS